MAFLDLPFVLVKSPELLQLLQAIQHSVNIMTEENFPSPLSGNQILQDFSTPLRKLAFREWPITLVAPAAPINTTTSVDCGGFFQFDPVRYPAGQWYLEAAMQVTSGGTATVQLRQGAAVIGSITTGASTWALVRTISPLVMPTNAAVLTVTLQSSATNITAQLWAARLVYIP